MELEALVSEILSMLRDSSTQLTTKMFGFSKKFLVTVAVCGQAYNPSR